MLSFFDPVRGMDYLSVLLRLLTATLCGAAIGIERSMKNRPAGFRTHILVCLGGAVAAVTAHFIYLVLKLPTDVTRLGGQVITGLGFIGAGTIIVTKKMSIKGLTTAAGLWTTGIVGLAAGSGFYEGALLGTALVLLTESTLAKLGARIRPWPEFALDLLYNDKDALTATMRYCKDKRMSIRNLQIQTLEDGYAAYEATIVLRGSLKPYELMEQLSKMPGIVSVSEA
jgi:putative Mg2+ transporter-C (MgtC) family protein